MILVNLWDTTLRDTLIQQGLFSVLDVVFLRQVAGMLLRKLGVDTWQKEGAERVPQGTGKNPFGNALRGGRRR